MKYIIIALALLFLFTCVRDAQAYPHTDKPGYHHCPLTDRVAHLCREQGGPSAVGSVPGSALDDRLAEDERHRDVPHRHGDRNDRETQQIVDDYEVWLHPEKDPEHRRLVHARERRQRCAGLEMTYRLRHGYGKPDELRGYEGCHLYSADARWHVEHPQDPLTGLAQLASVSTTSSEGGQQ